jgi:hypothetical protein
MMFECLDRRSIEVIVNKEEALLIVLYSET